MTEDEGEILRLDCVASNEFLNAYYTSFGFVYQGTRDGFAIYEYERIEATAWSGSIKTTVVSFGMVREKERFKE